MTPEVLKDPNKHTECVDCSKVEDFVDSIQSLSESTISIKPIKCSATRDGDFFATGNPRIRIFETIIKYYETTENGRKRIRYKAKIPNVRCPHYFKPRI